MTPLLRVLPLALLIAGLLAQTCGGQSQRAQQTADAQHSHQTPLFSAEFPHGSVGDSTIARHDDHDFSVISHFWYHNSRFYGVQSSAMVKANSSHLAMQTSKNIGIITLASADPRKHFANIQAKWLPGLTLLVDQPYPQFPDNMGFWAEVLLPLYSLLSSPAWERAGLAHVDQVLFANLHRSHLTGKDWVWEMLKLALAPQTPPGADMPRAIFYDDFGQLDRREWLCIQRAAVLNDRYTYKGSRSGFWTGDLAQRFRAEAYRRHGIIMPPAAPRTITLLNNAHSEKVVNEPEVFETLHDVGRSFGYRLRPLSMTAEAPFQSYLAAMARTGVLISRHGPQLANSMFLPPGAVVVELIPYNWHGTGFGEVYRNITTSTADVHHVAWRARHPRWALYNSTDDERYSSWTAKECESQHCVDAHAKAHMVVDTAAVAELTQESLAAVRGSSLRPALRPWPATAEWSGEGNWWLRSATGT